MVTEYKTSLRTVHLYIKSDASNKHVFTHHLGKMRALYIF